MRTGVETISDTRILFWAGNILRTLDDTLGVVDKLMIQGDEPIDIDYQDGAFWLGYPDGFLKSNPAVELSEVVDWTFINAPPGVTIHSFARYREWIAVLDAIQGKIHLLDTDGVSRLSWDALGTRLDKGDLSRFLDGMTGDGIIQTDGAGQFFMFMGGEPGF